MSFDKVDVEGLNAQVAERKMRGCDERVKDAEDVERMVAISHYLEGEEESEKG